MYIYIYLSGTGHPSNKLPISSLGRCMSGFCHFGAVSEMNPMRPSGLQPWSPQRIVRRR